MCAKIYISWDALKRELNNQRAAGKKIILTSGTFDLLHPGHIHLLRSARSFGDLLIVAVNSDDSVKRYKGLDRPINTLGDRMTVVAALAVVDYVVLFPQDTPQELIEYVQPDILVKGGDYKKESIAGGGFVESHGGSVYVVEYLDQYSTTKMIHSIVANVALKKINSCNR
ncbi:MAG: D-glycero-beta-D-manno-heptose 1-phosphate adenylyltransferase [Candidatus Babeliales bacterium]|jgi:D-beta-D-heptose 7-phosphate kinase/D-beta-D-heptose 1-phosphate adenosyltransferase